MQAGTLTKSSAQSNTYVAAPNQGVPQTAEEYRALRTLRSQLSEQISNIQSRREDIADQLKEADQGARQGLIDRLKIMDDRIVTLEKELDRTAALQRATPLAVIGASSSSPAQIPGNFANSVAQDLVPIVAILSVFVLGPIALTVSRMIWKRTSAGPARAAVTDQATQNRLEQLQQSVDTIAIEVERISEGQRFLSKALSERLPSGAES